MLMPGFVLRRAVHAWSRARPADHLRKNDEFCIKNEKLCIKNDGFCITNDEFCRSTAPLVRSRMRLAKAPATPASLDGFKAIHRLRSVRSAWKGHIRLAVRCILHLNDDFCITNDDF